MTKMRKWSRLLPVLCVAVLCGLTVGVGAASAETALTLSGESLFQLVEGTSQLTCQPDGSGTLTYTASGIAFGPYPGTFEETGSVTYGPSSTITAFSATFTISSSGTTVTGTKKPLSIEAGYGVCAPDGVFSIPSTYTAVITTPSGGCFTDEGQVAVFGSAGHDLNEHFLSSANPTAVPCVPPPPPPLPTSKDQCKEDGWKSYGVFKNEGDCVSFVATGGKNGPSGP